VKTPQIAYHMQKSSTQARILAWESYNIENNRFAASFPRHPSNQRRHRWNLGRSGVPVCRLWGWRQGATSPCRKQGWRQGPHALTAVDGVNCQATCWRWLWRHPHAGVGPGGTCHVSPGQMFRNREVVFFDKYFHRWFFLILRWRRWSYVSKILV
jgi:hypothetical protein